VTGGDVTAHQPDANGIITGINVTPLVDIALVLLIIFLVTAKMIVTPAVPLDLPRASRTQDVQVVFSLSLPANRTDARERAAGRRRRSIGAARAGGAARGSRPAGGDRRRRRRSATAA